MERQYLIRVRSEEDTDFVTVTASGDADAARAARRATKLRAEGPITLDEVLRDDEYRELEREG